MLEQPVIGVVTEASGYTVFHSLFRDLRQWTCDLNDPYAKHQTLLGEELSIGTKCSSGALASDADAKRGL